MKRKSFLPILIVVAVSIALVLPLRGNIASLPFGLYTGVGLSVGNLILVSSWIVGAISLIGILLLERAHGERIDRIVSWGIRCIGVLLTASIVLLTYYFIKSDFSISYVWQFSSRSLPTIYKISAVWAGQEGTYLLWAWCIFIYSWWILEHRGLQKPFMRKAQFVNLLVGMFFLTLTIMVTPFRTLYEIYPDVTPELVATIDGNGLNPLLQDPWMAVHPPIVFIAYAAVTIPFSGALIYLLTGEDDWEPYTRPWNRFAWLFLTLGIAVGGFWSYKVLGWGGYWAWDPVETSSFVPWLTLSGLMHASAQYRKRRMFKVFSPFLAVVTFLLVIYATFITRSGLWESVHAFAETTTGPWLAFLMVNIAFALGVLGLDLYLRLEKGARQSSKSSTSLIYAFIISQIFLIIYKKLIEKGGNSLPTMNQAIAVVAFTAIIFVLIRSLYKGDESKAEVVEEDGGEKGEEEKIELLTTSNLFYLAVVLLSILAFVSFWGITYPMLVQAKTGAKVSIGVEFFNKWSHPFTAFLVIVMGVCLLFGKIKKEDLIRVIGAVVVATVVIMILKPTRNPFVDSLAPILIFGGSSALYRIGEGVASARSIKAKIRRAGVYMIHLGVALTLIGAILSSVYDVEASTAFNFPAEKGIHKSIKRGYSLGVEDVEVYQTHDGWWATSIDVQVFKDGKLIGGGRPESIDNKKFGRVTHVYIHRGLASDVYVIFQGVSSQGPGNLVVPLTVKLVPGVGLLWLGIIFLSIGILPLILLDFELKLPPIPYRREEKPEVEERKSDREFLEKSLRELEESYKDGKISEKAYKTLREQYEKALREIE
jgi:cytochrome c-type biogenesis protein CcmF